MTATAITEEVVRVPGRGRELEGVLAYPPEQATCCALIAGPHPFLGGDMCNNVVRALLSALASHGCVTLAFNYAGVGRSEGGPADWPAVMSAFWKNGTFPEEGDWADDARSAIVSLRQWCDLPLVLIGYSFGCWAATRNLRESKAGAAVLISPNPMRHTFDLHADDPVPLLLIHSNNDFTCPPSEMSAWAETVREPKTRVQWPAGEHFFKGHEAAVAERVLAFLVRLGMVKAE